MKKLNEREFNKLKKSKDPKKILEEYMYSKINLTSSQLDEILKLKNGKENGTRKNNI